MNEYNKMRKIDITEIEQVSGGDGDSDCYYAGKKYKDGDTVTLAGRTTQVCQAGTCH